MSFTDQIVDLRWRRLAFAAAKAKAWRHSLEIIDSESDVGRDLISEGGISAEDDPLLIEEDHGGSESDSNPKEQHDRGMQTAVKVTMPDIDTRLDFALSSFRPNNDNVTILSERAMAVCLKPGESLTLVGQFDLRIKTGAASIYGAKIVAGPASYTIYAPASHSLPSIVCWPQSSTEIEISKSGNDTLKSLGKISPLYRRIWDNSSTPFSGALYGRGFSFLASSRDDTWKRLLQPLVIWPEWQAAMQSICSPKFRGTFRAMICGQKGSGKSTFVRTLINHVLTTNGYRDSRSVVPHQNRICLLDLDPGQPEFTAPGQVSLVVLSQPVLGPPFTHPISNNSDVDQIIRAHSIAAVSPKEDPEHFLSCAMDLLDCYKKVQQQYTACSLIVNCPGWIVGVALEITSRILLSSDMTDIVHLNTGDSIIPEVVQVLKEASAPAVFYDLSHAPMMQASTRTSADFRAMQNLSYFHRDHKSRTGQAKWNPSPLSRHEPWLVKYGARPDILGLMSLGEQPNPEFLSIICEGSLLAITIVEDKSLIEDLKAKVFRTETERLPYIAADASGLCLPPAPSKSRMVGLALLMHINKESCTIVLQTPVQHATLEACSARTAEGHPKLLLIRGQYDTPGWAFQQNLHKGRHDRRSPTYLKDTMTLHDEDLAISGEINGTYDEESTQADEIVETPWLKQLQAGEKAEERWRIRHDFKNRVPKRKRQ